MNTFNIHEAKTHLSRLIEDAVNGEPFIIAKAGKPLAKVSAMTSPAAQQTSRIGFMTGQFDAQRLQYAGRREHRRRVPRKFVITLLDTHLLLWAAAEPHKLSARATELIQDPNNEPVFSAASIWEVALKTGLNRAEFKVSSTRLRRGLFDNGYDELAITGRHAAAIGNLPDIHTDPFDRILIAQAQVDDVTLYTNDRIVASYPGTIELV